MSEGNVEIPIGSVKKMSNLKIKKIVFIENSEKSLLSSKITTEFEETDPRTFRLSS